MKTRWGRGARAFAWALVGLLTLGVPGSGLTLAAEQGSALTVASDPVGAAVYVDGKFQGQTPLSLASVAAGDHRVKVVKDGYLENSRLVNVRTGQPGALNVHLTPGSSNLRMQVDDQPSTPAAPRAEAKKGGGGKIALIAVGAAAVGGGAFILLKPKNKPPVAGTPAGTPTVALATVTSVEFKATGASDPDNDPLTYSWNFGDGSSGSGQTVTHVYPTAGQFSAVVTVSDGKKSASATAGAVTVRNMNGTWSGIFGTQGTNRYTLNFNQNGSTLVGSLDLTWANSNCQANAKTIQAGSVRAPRHVSVRMAVSTSCGGVDYGTEIENLECDLDPALNACEGTWSETGNFTYGTTMSRR